MGRGDGEEERRVPRYWGEHRLGSSSPGYKSVVLYRGMVVGSMGCLVDRVFSFLLAAAPMSAFLARGWHIYNQLGQLVTAGLWRPGTPHTQESCCGSVGQSSSAPGLRALM